MSRSGTGFHKVREPNCDQLVSGLQFVTPPVADDAVEVVDIGVPPMAQSEIVERAFAAGKDVLAQKPLALSISPSPVFAFFLAADWEPRPRLQPLTSSARCKEGRDGRFLVLPRQLNRLIQP